MLETVYRIWFHNREHELIYLDFLNAEIAAKLAEEYHASLVEEAHNRDRRNQHDQSSLIKITDVLC